eukprot:COSAG01_NODE_814_length_13398_cov_4.254230_4_plen_334_part_00
MNKKALVCGGGGFIGHHLVKRLKSMGYWVRAVDLKYPEFEATTADDFIQGDLRDINICKQSIYLNPENNAEAVDEVYQLAADMGGAGFVFTGDNDADIMHNSALINIHMSKLAVEAKVNKFFYRSSACIYPEHNQLDPDNPNCEEHSAYPANPDSEYGWEKLFSERLYLSFHRNYNLNVRVARFHNIFGPLGTWEGGREKAPAAMCRKVILADNPGEIEIWGDGKQTRSFLYIDACIDGIFKIMDSNLIEAVNLGSDEMVTINTLVDYATDISGKHITRKHIDGPLGVRGRNSDNNYIQEKIGWSPQYDLKTGLAHTYKWIAEQVAVQKSKTA